MSDSNKKVYSEAMNPANDPQKRYPPTHHNVNEDYPTYGGNDADDPEGADIGKGVEEKGDPWGIK